ncbi:hypothetical protein H112_08987 [Trichophyton rubrum D6]|nr:uncharacterized protein TERG_01532 [Trichophyton rubrum CBS 118892]EZF09702.1 hypothetical protein H100_09010 [Trichophyton rubrum MR850]EZF36531.1 hypothetical protein H102_08968 [Trichophyton rubrum CBS 100081]EZF47209.1 hypothetical protein H103_08991 [Trichophyton rubrum CBS 288.86]EZF57891.1 hypothetical protein H104_08939 [Trichophyton rubrum CBS 289.86]EZF79181.1 hypothetical protein H110_08991 [Trichophyton rubrum MR1448]EZF89798.1 hypothetical protein H113_09056 [Trichophyton rubr
MVKCTQASSKLELSLNNPAKDQETAVIPNQQNQAGNGDDHNLDDFPEGGARAWAVAIGTAGIAFCTLGVINSFGVLQGWYQVHQLEDRTASEISWIGSTQALFVFGGGVIGGPLFDLYGAKVIRPAALLYVVSIMLTSVCKEYHQFVLAQGILGGLSNGMTIFPAMSAGPQYFNKRRAAAMGIGIAGSSLGGVVWPIVLTVKARLPPQKTQFFLWSSFKETPYLYLVAAGFFGFLGVFTPLFYLPIYAYIQGAGVSLAFYLAAIFNAASFVGRVVTGILADKLGRFNMFFAATITSGLLTVCWLEVHTDAALVVFACFFGFCSGAVTTGMAVSFTSIPKDPRNIGTYMGMGMGIAAIAALVGPPINGALLSGRGFASMAYFSESVNFLAAFMVVIAKHSTTKGIFSNN